jgi:hypothetical protein
MTYNPAIPRSIDNLSVSQGQMLNNFGELNTQFGADHNGFEVGGMNGTGLHDQVTFGTNNVPTLPATPPVLFTNTTAATGSLAQLFYYSGDAAHSSTQNVTAANGSVTLLGGIIMKWGTFTVVNSGGFETSVTMVGTFPNTVYSLVLTPQTVSTGWSAAFTGTSTFLAKIPITSATTTFYYIALGV